MKLLLAGGMFLGALTVSVIQASAQMEYVRVCDAYGSNYFYSPGTETCINANTQEIRSAELGTEIGKTAFAASVDARIDQAFESAAVANALSDPDLVAGERFGVKVNWGSVESTHAFGIAGAVVVSDGLFSGGQGRLTGTGGVAFSGGTVGGRAGLQLTW